MTWRLCAAGFALLVSGVPRSSAAGSEPKGKLSVGIEAGDCSIVAMDDVLYLAKIELRGQLLDHAAGAACRVHVTCSGARVIVAAHTSDGRERIQDTDLSSVSGSVRPRVVALTVAELVHDLEMAALEPVEVAPPPTSGPPIVIPPETPSRAIALQVFALASTFRFDPKWLIGGGIGGAYARGHVVAGLDATLSTRDESSGVGTAQVLLTYLAPYLGWRASARRFTGQLGGGYAFGVARITGRATDPRAESGTLSELWGAPFAFASIGYAASDVVSVGVRAHAGWVSMPVVGLVWQGPSIDLTGPWTGAELGLALTL